MPFQLCGLWSIVQKDDSELMRCERDACSIL